MDQSHKKPGVDGKGLDKAARVDAPKQFFSLPDSCLLFLLMVLSFFPGTEARTEGHWDFHSFTICVHITLKLWPFVSCSIPAAWFRLSFPLILPSVLLLDLSHVPMVLLSANHFFNLRFVHSPASPTSPWHLPREVATIV